MSLQKRIYGKLRQKINFKNAYRDNKLLSNFLSTFLLWMVFLSTFVKFGKKEKSSWVIQIRRLPCSLTASHSVGINGSIKPLLSLWMVLWRRQPMTMTAISNAVTPNVIPAMAPAPSASRELCEEDVCLPWVVDFTFSCAGPSGLVSAASSATELDAKEIREMVY